MESDKNKRRSGKQSVAIYEGDTSLFEEINPAHLTKYRSYLPSPFIAASLPLRSVKSSTFTRKYNNLTLTLSSANHLPFGKYGRLLLTILTTHAVLFNENSESYEVDYDKLSTLLNEMDLPRSRGEKIKEQLQNFSKTSFIFEERKETIKQKYLFKDLYDEKNSLKGNVTVSKVSTGSIRFMAGFQFIEVDDGNDNKKNIAFRIIFSDEFVRFSKQHAVPIDYSIYKSITSDVGKDLYAWLIYRNHSLTEPLFIPRQALINQFMPVQDDKKKDNEKANYAYIIDQLKKIKRNYYKDLNIDISTTGGGITLYKSPVPIAEVEKRYVLVTSNL